MGKGGRDWNHDFVMDVASASERGWRLALADSKGGFRDVTSRLTQNASATTEPSFGIWTADVEMDGDLDLIVGRIAGSPLVVRNNGDGTAAITDPFPGVSGLRAFAWADLDDDADPDAVLLDHSGRIHLLANEQAGRFTPMRKAEIAGRVLAMTLADTNNDGRLELLTLDDTGSIRRDEPGSEIAKWSAMPPGVDVGRARLFVADLDNNGAPDLVASSPGGSRIWLSDQGQRLIPFNARIDSGMVISDVVDTDDDGRLDLLRPSSRRPVPPPQPRNPTPPLRTPCRPRQSRNHELPLAGDPAASESGSRRPANQLVRRRRRDRSPFGSSRTKADPGRRSDSHRPRFASQGRRGSDPLA